MRRRWSSAGRPRRRSSAGRRRARCASPTSSAPARWRWSRSEPALAGLRSTRRRGSRSRRSAAISTPARPSSESSSVFAAAMPPENSSAHWPGSLPRPMALTDPSKRLEAIPPYMFAELERKVAEKRAAGIDVISLGIGDPDRATYPHIVEAMKGAVEDPGTHQYPSNRGREDFRRAFAGFYRRRFGVDIDPESEVIPAIGAKECIYHLCFAFLDPGDVALAADPGYPVYTGGPLL